MSTEDTHRNKIPAYGDTRRSRGGGTARKPVDAGSEPKVRGMGEPCLNLSRSETRKASRPAPEWTVPDAKSIGFFGLVSTGDIQLVFERLLDQIDGVAYVKANTLDVENLSNKQIGYALAALEQAVSQAPVSVEIERWSDDDDPVVYRVELTDGPDPEVEQC